MATTRHSVNRKSTEMVGKLVNFIPSENDPLRVFGLPKSLFLEVKYNHVQDICLTRLSLFQFRLLSKPYTVI